MTGGAWAEHVLPHGPLTQLAPRVWQVTGQTPGFGFPRNMTLWRMDDGGLWVHSAVACDATTMAEIEALGPPAVLVVPANVHRLDAAVWKARYPALRVVCPAGVQEAVARALPVDGTDADVPGVLTHALPGVRPLENAYQVDAGAGHALVFCDALFNVRPTRWVLALVLFLIGGRGFGMTRVARWRLLRSGPAFAAWLRARAMEPTLALLCLCHGDAVLRDPAPKLREAAAKL